MASTNKTTHYELSQYVGTDKPTYLTDYNQDMSRIDAGIYGAKAEADTNASSIGTLSNLTTTAQSDLVSAINEVDGDVATNTANISTNTSNIDANTTAIGVLTNLTTSAKNNLVSAINEVDANCDSNTSSIGTLSNLTTTAKTDLVSAVNEINSELPDYYDSIEHKTNKIWIDNKPVYRIVLSDNLPDAVGGWHSIDVSSLNIDHLVDLHMKFISSNDEEYFNNFYISDNYALTIRYNGNFDEVQYNIGTGYASTSASYRIIIEYTKNN